MGIVQYMGYLQQSISYNPYPFNNQIAAHVHGDQPWLMHQDNEEIDYSTAFSRTGEYAQRDYDSEFVETGLEDAFGSLGSLSKDELDYYTNLPEPDEDSETG